MKRKQFLSVVSKENASMEFSRFTKKTGTEKVKLNKALGRVLAKDIIAEIDVPPFNRSMRDGFAVIASDTYYADEEAPKVLKLNKEIIAAGISPKIEVKKGNCSEIATGAVMPRGANAVVMIEDCHIENNSIKIIRPVVPGENIAHAGSDCMIGETLARESTVITSRETALLSSQGLTDIEVFKKPCIAIISTGDEIVELGAKLKEGQIFDTNAQVIGDIIQENGGNPIYLGIVRDDLEQVKRKIKDAMHSDMLILSGGTSAGAGDVCYRALEQEKPGIIVHGVAIKPGKPLVLGAIEDNPVEILPGFPTSAIVTFHIFVKPIIRQMAGLSDEEAQKIKAKLAVRYHSKKGVHEFCMVDLVEDAEGNLSAYPITKSSGSITTFVHADGFIEIGQKKEMALKDEETDVTLLSDRLKLSDVIFIGSQCIGLEPAYSMLRRSGYQSKVVHVGSTTGLQAARRGESDISPTHLLDEKTNTYNITFIKDDKDLILFKGYIREQGIIFRKELSMTNIQDFVNNKKLRMINRNKGSGTRVLFDMNLKKMGDVEKIAADIAGYEVEAKSHNAVAAAIATKKADWGIAIKSAAVMYNLEFIPIREENYDFCIPKSKLKKESIQEFLRIIRSKEFHGRLLSMKGFKIPEDIGTEIKLTSGHSDS
jgi:putative molybdopterin biosynthesis protein